MLGGARGNPAGRACPKKPHLVGVDPGVKSRRLDGSDCVGRHEVEVTVDIGAALTPGLANAALVVGEEGDAVVDVGGDEWPIAESWLLAAAVKPDHGGVLSLCLGEIDRAPSRAPSQVKWTPTSR